MRTLGRKPHYGDQFSPAFTRGVGMANMHLAGPPSAARIPNHPNSIKHPAQQAVTLVIQRMLHLNPVVLAHAPADHAYAQELATFLELGCDVRCDLKAGQLRAHEHLVDLVEQCPEHLILLLSQHSWPQRLPRERWDPVLLARPLACVLIEPCPYPTLLERRVFFDVQKGNVGRSLKRWLWQQHRDPVGGTRYAWSSDLEELYAVLADRHGTQMTATGEVARRFVREASSEFECVLWIACHQRTLVEAMGELGSLLGMVLDGQERDNRLSIHEMLAVRRCLIVLDAPSEQVRSALTAFGRSSTLITTEPVEIRQTPCTFEYARLLVKQQRLTEAYDVFYALMNEAGEPGFCPQELAWICDHWGRTVEAESLRQLVQQTPSHQMGLFD